MIYIYTFAASIFFAYLAERSKDKGVVVLCSVISILIPSILGGLRAHGVGTDTIIYGLHHASQALASPSFAHFMSINKSEPGYKLLCYFVMKTFGNVNWCYFFYQLITVSCFYIGAYKHRKIVSLPLTMLIFYLYLYQITYNIMRQSIATSIIFMGLNTLENKQYFKFTVYVLVATLFHYSSLMALMLLLFVHFITTSDLVAKSYYMRFVILCGAALPLVFAKPLLNVISHNVSILTKYIGYLDGTYDVTNYDRSFLLIAFGEFIMLIFYGKEAQQTFSKLSNNNFEFFKMNLVVIVSITYFINFKFITERFILASHFVDIILLSSMPKFVKEKYLKVIVGIVVIAVLAFYWWNTYIRKNNHETWPYRSIL